MLWLFAFITAVLFIEIRKQWPVKGLQYIDIAKLNYMKETDSPLKLVDIREATDYYQEHLDDSVNIFVGRIPHVWRKNFGEEETVVLIGKDRKSINKAAKFLFKHAPYSEIYGIFYPYEKGTAPDKTILFN